MRKIIILAAFLLATSLFLSSCSPYLSTYSSQGGEWNMGFGSEEIALPENSDDPLYIAGYQNGAEIEGVLDIPRASAVWIDVGENAVLLIGVDCVALGIGTVNTIRDKLADFCRESKCISVNVYATHSHAGVDTLGLWGPPAIDGKNSDYMSNLVNAAVNAAKEAYSDRSPGALYYGSAEPEDLLHDSRAPIEYDPLIHQLRFVPDDASKNGIRLLSYAAHAESLRGDNRMLSRDFPGALADNIRAVCGDDVMYMPGAIGGLIMTRETVEPFDAEANMRETAKRLAEAVMSVESEIELSPSIAFSSVELELPLDNTFFFFAKFLGIIDNKISSGDSETGYIVQSELGVLRLGKVTLALIPGEIFPELVSGRGLGEQDPEALSSIALRYNADKLLVVGLCNDELGYIVPPSAYMVNDEMPYFETVTDATGENHYEETNSVGNMTAECIAKAFERALQNLQ